MTEETFEQELVAFHAMVTLGASGRSPAWRRERPHITLPANRWCAAAGRRARDRAGRRGGAGMSARPPTPAVLHLVPHTHWDREWYEPFQRFRLRLVALLDEVLDRMPRTTPGCASPSTGSCAAVDDYLEVRPEHRARVARWSRAGRLAVGPWQILLDEFLVLGREHRPQPRTRPGPRPSAGGAMPVGYLPDMFGHTAQMPQILRRAGLAHACVFRGVPARGRPTRSPGSPRTATAIRAEYLPGGYGNAADLFDDPDAGRPPGGRPAGPAGGRLLGRRPGAGHVRHGPRRALPDCLTWST